MKRIFERQSAFVKTLLICVPLMFLLCATRSWAETYTGTLKYGDGLKGATAWKSSTLKWTVDDNTHPGLWTYSYSFSVEAKEISHVIIEVAEGFKQQNLRGDTTPKYELGTFGHKGNSTPGIPGDIRGMKWETSGKALTYSWVIVTDRAPMWGDFYAKDGKDRGNWVFSYNTGFGSEPPDLTIKQGNNGRWVLVPGMMTYHEHAVSNFALNAFKRIRSLVDPKDETIPRPEFIGSHIEVTSESWAYVLDNTGQQIFRPKATYPHLKESFQHDIGQGLPGWIHVPVDPTRIKKAKELTLSMVGVDYLKNVRVTPARELIASKSSKSETIDRHYEGRTVVMFTPPTPADQMVKSYSTAMTHSLDGQTIVETRPIDLPGKGYETAVTFSPSGNLMRIESAFLAPEVRRIVAVFREGLKMGAIKGRLYDFDPDIRFGSFFSSEEWRFESTAYSWEGQDFVTTNEPWCEQSWDLWDECNPYYREYVLDSYPCLDAVVPDFGDIWTMPRYKYDYWQWWNNKGRTNGIRGNFVPSSQSWEIPSYDVVQHKSLKPYGLTSQVNTTMDYTHCDETQPVKVKQAGGVKLEPQFYDDLEWNHIAVISTHGGTYSCDKFPFYQVMKERELWVSLHREGDKGLGYGSLRHLFLTTCSSMNWNHGPKHGDMPNIASDWMNNHIADGIRTICGADGPSAGAHMSGLKFFNKYRYGESISQAWFDMVMDECTCNVPVTVAYGSTEEEAAINLFDGRFTKTPGSKGWVIAAELITEHLTTHQACCVAPGRCIDVSYEDCKDPWWVWWNTGGDFEVVGTPMGTGSLCATYCPQAVDYNLCK
jgi:hypothetical protein